VEQMMITTRQRNITTHFGTMVRHARGKVKGQEVERALKTEEEEEKKEEEKEKKKEEEKEEEKKEEEKEKKKEEEKEEKKEEISPYQIRIISVNP
jgi:hypothetical protein